MGIADNKINEYLDKICSLIKNKDVHNDIRLELKDHIETLKEEGLASGLSEEDALDKAITHMGDAELIGKQLNKSHRARLDLVILIPTLFLCFFGLISMYFIQANGAADAGFNEIFQRSLVSYSIGTILMIGLFLFDYRKLLAFSKYIYIGNIFILVYMLFFGTFINGNLFLSIGSISIDFVEISPIFIIISLAGIFQSWNWASLGKYILGLVLMALPAFFILVHNSLSTTIIYSVSCLILMIASKAGIFKVILPVAGSVFFGYLSTLTEPYRIKRLLFFLDPYQDPKGMGWIYIQIKNALNSAGFLGKGIASAPKTIPSLQSDYIFTYFTYTFGWFAAIVLLLLISLFLIRMIRVSQFVKNSYGKLLVKGIASILCAQFILSITTSLGISPFFGVSMPFMSFGGSQIIVNMMSAGLILSIYRRKALIAAADAI